MAWTACAAQSRNFACSCVSLRGRSGEPEGPVVASVAVRPSVRHTAIWAQPSGVPSRTAPWMRAAKAWDEMATRAEKTAERKSVNEEAKMIAEMMEDD